MLDLFVTAHALRIVKRRVILKNGEYIRYQAGRRHKRFNKPKGQLRALKKTVPLFKAYAKKLKKLGYTRSWWWTTR
jgi:ribosomal protein L35